MSGGHNASSNNRLNVKSSYCSKYGSGVVFVRYTKPNNNQSINHETDPTGSFSLFKAGCSSSVSINVEAHTSSTSQTITVNTEAKTANSSELVIRET